MKDNLLPLHSFYNTRFYIIAILYLFLNVVTMAQTSHNRYHPAYEAKEYSRYELFSGSRADANGSMQSYVNSMREVAETIRTKNKNQTIATEQWYPLGPSKTTHPTLAQLGLVSALYVDRSDYQTLYAGSNTGGIFKTIDGGENWFSISDNYVTTGVLAIQVDPKDNNHIYIATGHWGFNRMYSQGVMESFDAGETWSHTGLDGTVENHGFAVHDLKTHLRDSDTLYSLINTEFQGSTSIYRSKDKAQSWERVYFSEKNELFDLISVPTRPDTIYAAGTKILRSSDAGDTWEDLTAFFTQPTNYRITRLTLAASETDHQNLLVFSQSYDTTSPSAYAYKLFRSTNYGLSFEEVAISFLPYAGYWKMELMFSPNDNNEFYLGGIYLFKYRIEQDSALYIECSDHKYHRDVRAMHVFKEGDTDVLYMGNDGGITRSPDGAETWIDITRNGFQATQLHNITISDNSNMMFGGPQDGNLCFYNYTTGEWSKDTHIGDAYDGMIDYEDANNVYMVLYPPKMNTPNIFMIKSTDGGKTFNYNGVPDNTERGRNNAPVAMHPVNPKTLFAGLTNLWKSTDGAETWEKISNFSAEYDHKIQAVEVAESNPNVICVSFENPTWGADSVPKVFATPNGGTAWYDITPRGPLSLAYTAVNDILIHPNKPATIYLALDRTWQNRKVYKTNDGGSTWVNFSEGLPNIPINALRFLKGAGYDILLAATDAGVYFRDANMETWEPFGEGLPLTIVSDIEINYARKKIVAGTFGRGLWEIDYCIPVSENTLFVTDTLQWPEGNNIFNNIVLQPGSKLTLKGKVEMGQGRSISVMPGAQLRLEKATLTNNCINLWEGIKLYGNPDYDSSNPQGIISITDGSVIENAYLAIETIAVDESGQVIPNKGGGIIYANKSTFKNNQATIDFKPTTGHNPSTFTSTDFIFQAPNWSLEEFPDMVTINSNRGIRFISCRFENKISHSDLPVGKRGRGIKSYNSSFEVYKVSPDSVPFGTAALPIFYQFDRGIEATVGYPGFSIKLSNARFENNFTGAYLNGYSNVVATNNSFVIASHTMTDNSESLVTGLYIDQCPMYHVSGNTFLGMGPVGIKLPMTGLVINHCGEVNNMVGANIFNNLKYALLVQNQNRSTDGYQGLHLMFNNFTKNEYDVAVTKNSSYSVTGIAYNQGAIKFTPIEPAGNQFSYSNYVEDGDFHNEGLPVLYFHYPNVFKGMRHVPKKVSNLLLVENITNSSNDTTYIPDYLKIEPSQLSEEYIKWTNQSRESADFYISQKDGGNTNKLINKAKQVTIDQSQILYNELRKSDSRLSEDVILALTQNNHFPNTFLKDVLLHNPIIFRTPGFWEALNNRNPKMPSYMVKPLITRAKVYSEIELLRGRRDNIQAVADGIFTQKINMLLFDESLQQLEDLNSLLLTDGRFESMVLLASLYYNAGNDAQVDQVIEEAKINFPQYTQSISNIKSLFTLDKQLQESHNNTLPTAQLEVIIELMNDKYTTVHAINILKQYNLNNYTEPYILPVDVPMVPPIEIPDIPIAGSIFKIYPQPASSFIMFEYAFEQGLIKGQLEISTITGQHINTIAVKGSYGQQFIDVSSILPGLYIFNLKSDNKSIERQKVMIIR